MDIERRNYSGAGVEFRESDGGSGMIGGHAAVFDTLVTIWDFQERFTPGSFAQTIADDDVRALWNHESSFPLGRTGNGTLRLSEDKTGLVFENDPPLGFIGEMARESIRRGDVSGASIGFIAVEDQWSKEDGVQVRTITRAQLFDVSPVTFPAYPTTDVQARARFLSRPELPEEVRESLVAAIRDALPKTDGLDEAIEKALRGQVDAIAERVAEMLKEERRLVVEAADRHTRSLQLADAEL